MKKAKVTPKATKLIPVKAKVARASAQLSCAVLTPLLLAVGFCAVLLVAISMPANSGTLDKAGVEKIVADYIAANGEKIMESLQAAEQRSQMASVEGMITPDTPVRGPATAKVTIIEFGDFECPFCLRVQQTLRNLEKAYDGQIRFAFKHLPLAFHEQAKPAAYASIAAHKQGKFWEYAEKLWTLPGQPTDAQLVATAEALKLDMKKFNTDRASPAVAMQVSKDLMDAAKSGARGTPYFFVNGMPLSGALPEEEFRATIDAALKDTE